jgi:hypothetical protein
MYLKRVLLVIVLLVIASLAWCTTIQAGGASEINGAAPKDGIIIKRMSSHKGGGARLLPGSVHESLCFTSSAKPEKSYQLFLFDIDGKLIRQSSIAEKQTAMLMEMKKGHYFFEIFSNDVRIENGSIVIR